MIKVTSTIAARVFMRWLSIVLAIDGNPVPAQEPGFDSFAQRPRQMRTQAQRLYDLQVHKARWKVDRQKLEMESRKSDYEATRDLFDQKIETLDRLHRALSEYRQSSLAFEEAQLQLERTRLSFLTDATHIAILEAKKYRTADGRRRVDLLIQNDSNLAQATSLNPDRAADDVRKLLEVQDIEVSLQEQSTGLIIAEPYELTVPSLKHGQMERLSFRLMEDHDDVLVAMTVHGSRRQDKHIVLRREALQEMPSLSSAQFSQEADLNSRVRFDLAIERLAEEERAYHLAVVNLPQEIDAFFIDRKAGAELSQIKLDGKTTRREVDLELRIPAKLDSQFVGTPLVFYALVTDREGIRRIGHLGDEYGVTAIPVTRIIEVGGNSTQRLELTARGRAGLEIVVNERYHEIGSGDPVIVQVDLFNPGTLRVIEVRVDVAVPLGWTYMMVPDKISALMPGERESMNVTLTPGSVEGVSEYDIRLFAQAVAGHGEKIEATEEDIAIRIEPRTAVWTSVLLIAAMLCLVVALVIVTVRTSRR